MNAPASYANTRTLVLTGASRGIGHATVKKFSASGWRVITVSRQPFSALCPWPSGGENHVELDLADPVNIGQGIEQIRERLAGGRLDALVNNAAISPKNGEGGRLGAIDTPFDLWQRVFNVNFFAPVALARGLMKELAEARGCVVNVTSIAGSRVHPFAGSAYATSKAALAALTREMAHDFGPRGIRVNAIAPGLTDTAQPRYGNTDDELVEMARTTIPLGGKLLLPDQIARTAVFLASDEASAVTGQVLHVNGGSYMP